MFCFNSFLKAVIVRIGFVLFFAACQGFHRHGTVGGRDPSPVRSPLRDGGPHASQGITQPVTNILPLARLGTRGHVHQNHGKPNLRICQRC